MFAASTYSEIISRENDIDYRHIIVLLFVRPTNQNALDIIKEFEYIHYNSRESCSIYAVGYSNDFIKASEDSSYTKVGPVLDGDWYFSNIAFVEFKDRLEKRIHWKYSGETELLILQNSPGSRNPLCFSNYVAINVNKGIREGYMDSFQSFMESLIRGAKQNVTAKKVVRDIQKERISIKSIITGALDDCKKVPTPIRKIIKDNLFYRSANRI